MAHALLETQTTAGVMISDFKEKHRKVTSENKRLSFIQSAEYVKNGMKEA